MPVTIPQPIKTVETRSPARLTTGSGRIVWAEGFENNQNKFSAGSIANTATRVITGAYALAMTSAAGSPFQTETLSKVVPIVPFFYKTKVGMEIWFIPEAVTTAAAGLAEIRFDWVLNMGYKTALAFTPRVKLLFGATTSDAKLQIYNGDTAAFEDVTGSTMSIGAGYGYRLKLVFSTRTGYHDKLEFGDQTFDVSSIKIAQAASAGGYSLLDFFIKGIDATTKSMWIDNIVLTSDEP